MNKSVLIATCDFLVLAVLSLNPSDKGSYSSPQESPTARPILQPSPTTAGALMPTDDFKVEPIKQIVLDDFDNQLLLLAADDEKIAMNERLKLAVKDAEIVKQMLKKEQLNRENLKSELLATTESNKSLKQNMEAERKRSESAYKKQKELDSELANLRQSFVGITGANQENQAMLTNLQKDNKTMSDSRVYMKTKLLKALLEKQQMQAELKRVQKLSEETTKAQKEAEAKLTKVAATNLQLESDLKVTQYKHEVILQQQKKVEAKLDKVAEERNSLQSNLAVIKKESEVLNNEVGKLQKQIFGPSPEINKALFKTTIKIRENDYMASSYTHSCYSPVVNIGGKYFTLANYKNMWLNKAIVPSRTLLEFSIVQRSEVSEKSYRVSKSFSYFTNSAQTLLIPCAAEKNAIKVSASAYSVADAVPTLFIMKQDTGKVLKLNNMFYDRTIKRLVMERGLAEETSANQPELGDLIVDPQGDLVGVFAKSESNFSLSKSTRLEAFIITDKEPITVVDIQDKKQIPAQVKKIKWSIND